jgi:uncharacterized protein (TIGR02266 family)
MRTPITLKIKFKSGSLDQFIERYSVDVSRGGIFIRTKEPLQVGTQLKFEFQLQDASSLIAGEGTVVWIREHDPTRTGVAPGMGVRFDRLQPASMQVLDRILTEKSKRGDAQMESRFDAGVRASATASGTVSTPDKAKPHNDFGGGDSKSHTPLPAPVPGLDSPGDEFAEESTRVMQNEIVQALADKTREEQASFDNEPTRKATKDEVATLTATSAKKTTEMGPVSDAKPAGKIEVVEPKVEAKKELPKEEKVVAASAEKKEEAKQPEKKEPAKEPERKVAVAAAAPQAQKRGSSLAIPAFIVVVAAVGGIAYYAFRGDDTSGASDKPPVAAADNPSSDKPATATNDKPAATSDKPAANHDKPTSDKPAVAMNDKPAVDKPAVDKPAADKPEGLSVAIVSSPPGAQVTVDGKPLDGPTPTTLAGLDVKKVYEVRVALKGFHEWKIKYKPKAGDKVDAALVPNEKLVEVTSTPQGADVLLDGKKVGKTPFTIHKIDVSKAHALEVKHSGFVAQSRSISASDAFESKGDRDVLAVALKLDPEPKEKPAVAARVPKKQSGKKPEKATEDKPAVAEDKPQTKPVEAANDKPTEDKVEKPVEKPTVDKPEKAADKPEKAADKPEKVADKPEKAADKPEKAADKPDKPKSEKPADNPAIKTPSWMKSSKPDQPESPPAQ